MAHRLEHPLNLPPRGRDSLLILIIKTARIISSTIEQHAGMSLSRIRILARLNRKGELPQLDIQEHLDTNKSSISRILQALEDDGLVRRRVDPWDNRHTLVDLTAQGARVSAERAAWRDTFEKELTIDFSEEEKLLLKKLLNTILTRLEGTSSHSKGHGDVT